MCTMYVMRLLCGLPFFSWKIHERELDDVWAASPAGKYVKICLCSKSKDVISVPRSDVP